MRVYQHSVTQRSVTQRKSFHATKKCCVRYFFTQPQTPRLLAVLRKQVETTSIFFRNAGGEIDQSEMRLRKPMAIRLCETLRRVYEMLENAL